MSTTEETVIHTTDVFSVIKADPNYTIGDTSDAQLVNWVVKHNTYDTVEYESQNLIDALTVCEHMQDCLNRQTYIRTDQNRIDINNLIDSINNGETQVLNFPDTNSNANNEEDNDNDPSIN